MIEVSLADEIMDISELETFKKVLLNEFEVKENDLENLISDAKKSKLINFFIRIYQKN